MERKKRERGRNGKETNNNDGDGLMAQTVKDDTNKEGWRERERERESKTCLNRSSTATD